MSCLNEASKQANEVILIPKLFQGYIGYNEIERKKIKTIPLSSDVLHLHAQALC